MTTPSHQPPQPLDPRTACMVRVILAHYDEQALTYEQAVQLMSDLVACDRADRGAEQ